MPSYTPVDPSAVAFNPNGFVQGAGQSLELFRLVEKLKADKALQDELSSTRANRVGATNATNLSTILTEPERAKDVLAGYRQNDALRDSDTKAKLARMNLSFATDEAELPNVIPAAKLRGSMIDSDLTLLKPKTEFGIKKYENDLRALEPLTDASIAEAAAREAEAKSSVALADMSKRLKESQMDLALHGLQFAKENLPTSQIIEQYTLQDKYQNLEKDLKQGRDLKEVEIDLKKANAEYARGLGRQAGGAQNPESEVRSIESALKTQSELPVGDGRPFRAYLNESFNEDGTRKKTWGGLGSAKPLDPVGEALIIQRDHLLNRLNQINISLNDRVSARTVEQKGSQSLGGSKREPQKMPTFEQRDGLPVFTVEQAQKAPAGTEFYGTDGKKYVKK